jgi:hypothetical protein
MEKTKLFEKGRDGYRLSPRTPNMTQPLRDCVVIMMRGDRNGTGGRTPQL